MSSTAAGLQVGLLVVALAVVYKPLGDYMARVFTSTRHLRVERAIYRVVRVDPGSEQHWKTYASAVLGFSAVSIILLFLLQRLQSVLPFNFGRGAVEPGIAFNTAVSFVTNTNWQSYVPEKIMGHTVQMVGLTVQNFLSATVGLAVAIALIRGFVRARTDRLGNFWVDLTRGTIRILLPISFVFAILLIALGMIQSLKSGVDVTNVDGQSNRIALAPTASQEVIKELGTNGGGIFNANSAHPFENPNAWTNLITIFLILVIPVSLTRTFGQLVGNRKQGSTLLSVMAVLWGAMLAVIWWAEAHPNGPAGRAARGRWHGGQGGGPQPS